MDCIYTYNNMVFDSKESLIAFLTQNQRDKLKLEYLSKLNNFIDVLGISEEDKNNILSQVNKRITLNEDKSLTESALLSAATDNAKELILAKINAGTATAAVYIHLTMMGVPFLDIADMMISPTVQWIVNYAKGNIFDKSKQFRTVDSAIKAYQEGPNPQNYMDFDTSKSANKYFKNLIKEKIKLNKDQLEAINIKKNNVLNALFLRDTFSSDEIKKIVSLMKDNIPNSLSKSGSFISDDMEDFIDMSDFEDFNDFNDFDDNKIDTSAKIPVGRFVYELEDYFNKVGYSINKDIFDQFSSAYEDAKEITILGKKLGINQGIKTDPYSQYTFFNDMNVFWNEKVDLNLPINPKIIEFFSKKYNVTPEDAQPLIIGLTTNFTFKKFISGDDSYKEDIIKIYDNYKSVYNIFDIINTSPHFREMLNISTLAEDVQNITSIKYRTINNMIDEIFDRKIIDTKINKSKTLSYNPILSDKNYLRLSDFFNDVIISKFLKNLNFSINYFSSERWNEKMIKEQLPIMKDENDNQITSYNIDLSTVHGRTNFLDMFENMVIGLQKGYTKKNGKIIESKNISNNLFIKDLVSDYRKDPLSGVQEKYYRLPINILSNNEYDSTQFNNYVIGFQNLNSIEYEGIPIKDIFFLYNLIINRDKINKDSFTKLFEYDTKFSKDSLMYKYIKFIGDLDNSETVLKEIESGESPDYNIDDLILKGFANKILDNQLKSGRFFGKYIYVTYINGNKKVTEYYKWNNESYEEYEHRGKISSIPLSTDNVSSMELLKVKQVEDKPKINIDLTDIPNYKINTKKESFVLSTKASVDGYKIVINNFPNFKSFVYKLDNYWQLIEETTGLPVANKYDTRKEAVEESLKVLNNKLIKGENLEILNKTGYNLPITEINTEKNIDKKKQLYFPDVNLRSRLFDNKETISTKDILTKISKSNHPLNILASKLLDNVSDKILSRTLTLRKGKVDKDGNFIGSKRGEYISGQIYIYENANFRHGQAEKTIMHEIMHSVTMGPIYKDRNSKIHKDLHILYDYSVKNKLSDAYGYKDVGEFVAELYTNSEFANQLTKIPPIEGFTQYKNFFQQIVDFITTHIGFKKSDSLYHQATALVSNLFIEDVKFNYSKYTGPNESEAPFSKSTEYYEKSKDSKDKIITITNKLKDIYNVDIKVLPAEEIHELFKDRFSENPSVHRAFIIDGTVYINADLASSAEPLHEMSHIILSTIKSSDFDLYNEIVQKVKTHPEYENISRSYPERSGSDLDEEVFCTIFAEQYRDTLRKEKWNGWYDTNKSLFQNIINFIKNKFSTIFGNDSILGISNDSLVKMSLDDLINKFGNEIMDGKFKNFIAKDIAIVERKVNNLKNKLLEEGILKSYCE